MPASSRHGRQPTFSKPIAWAFWLVVVGVVAVAVLAEERLAMRLAIAGALSASLMIWSVYDAALKQARVDVGRERKLHARTVGASADDRRAAEREITRLTTRVADLELELAHVRAEAAAAAPDAAELWPDLSEAPTVVDITNRREARPAAKPGPAEKRASSA